MPKTSTSKLLILNYKLFLVFILIFSFFSFQFFPIFAQSPLNKAKSDYATQLKTYDQAKENYITAKSNYTAFKTATSKTEAYTKTKDYLVASNFLITNYLLLLREISTTIHWENASNNKEETLKFIDDEVSFLQSNWQNIQSANTLEELPSRADELSTHLNGPTNSAVNRVLATYELAQIEYALFNFNSLSEKLINYANPKVKEENRAIINNWQTEINSIRDDSETHVSDAKKEFDKVALNTTNRFSKEGVLHHTKFASEKLMNSKNLFAEILRII